ncbi:MAG: hypothetical protein ACE5DY_07080 [Mariprofundaceae bacterium]
MKKPVHLFSYDSPLGGIGLHVQNGICRRVFLQETDAPPCPSHLQLTLWLDTGRYGHSLYWRHYGI